MAAAQEVPSVPSVPPVPGDGLLRSGLRETDGFAPMVPEQFAPPGLLSSALGVRLPAPNEIAEAQNSSELFDTFRWPLVHPPRPGAPDGSHCGEDLVLIVRGSSEKPQGDQPDRLTYQQVGNDLFARDLDHGGGYLLKGAREHLPADIKVATLVYRAVPIGYKGGLTPTLDNFHESASEGGAVLLKALDAIYGPCGDNPPNLVVVGYSQGADVINHAIATHTTGSVEQVNRFVLLADPSRRPIGVENEAALMSMSPGNSIGGVSRAVTAAVRYGLVLPTLDRYRDTHPGQISSYCVPGDLVCDTRAAEATRGTYLHTAYLKMVARCEDSYTTVMNCLYTDVLRGLGRNHARATQPPLVVEGSGTFTMSISRLLRNETIDQTVDVVGSLGAAPVFNLSTSIDAGSAGTASVLLPPVPITSLDVLLDGRLVGHFPVNYRFFISGKNSAAYIQGAGEKVDSAPPPPVSQIQGWELPFHKRVELVRQVFGPFGEAAFRFWYGFALTNGLDPEHSRELVELDRAGELLGTGSSVPKEFVDQVGIVTPPEGLPMFKGVPLVNFLGVFAAVI